MAYPQDTITKLTVGYAYPASVHARQCGDALTDTLERWPKNLPAVRRLFPSVSGGF